jgi:hypothetical protein
MAQTYSDRVKCKSCENGSGPYGCTDCLNTGHDPQAFAGGIDAALNDAYAEGRKDEREEALCVAFHDKDQPNGIAWCPGYPEGLRDITPLYATPNATKD